MLHTQAGFADAVARAVAAIESRSDAEVVVVAAARSGSYRDLAWATGAVAAWLTLALLAWLPQEFDGMWFPIDAAAVGAVVGVAVGRSPRLLGSLAGRGRQRRQVREAAEAAFFQESVHGTARRTGLLVYVSGLERRVEVIPDHGLQGRIPGARWAALDVRAGSLDELVGGLGRLGDLLAAYVPAHHADNPNELADAPRIRA
jgi:putative membrane protein